MDKKSMRIGFGKALVELGESMPNLMVLDSDLKGTTMTGMYEQAYPDRFFDFGIAECNMVAQAAGMAHCGAVVFASTFAVFGAGKAYEIMRNAVCHTDANVKLVCSHAGVTVGEDGGSHQMLEDVSLMRSLPNITVIVPCDHIEMYKATKAIAGIHGPAYMRTVRPPVEACTDEDTPFKIGKANIMREGSDLCIIACGDMVVPALEAHALLKEQGVSAAVVNMHTIKPIDRGCIKYMAEKCGRIITVENHSVIGGLASAVSEVLAEEGLTVRLGKIGIKDVFGQSGSAADLQKEYGLTAGHIVNAYNYMK